MKTLFKVLAGLAVVIAAGVVAVIYFTSGLTRTADDFFDEVGKGDFTAAYQYLSEDFRATTSTEEFQRFLEDSALLHAKSTSWSSRSVSGNRGKLEGSVTTDSGGVVPVELGFVKEKGAWLIYSIHKPQAGLAQDHSGRMPGESEQVALVRETMRYFADAVNASDFTEFHGHVARLWQSQITPAQLKETFQSFWSQNIDLTPINGFPPIFDSTPAIDDDGVLEIRGHYATSPSRVLFDLKYIYEGTGWKLFGIHVNVEPAE